MERVNRIWEHEKYRIYMQGIREAETDRIYCLHDVAHCLDVARIAYILNVEEGLGVTKDVVYAAALLHDIGRYEEYRGGRMHHEAGAKLAEPILADAGYTEEERTVICDAIGRHKAAEDDAGFASLLYRADKRSRRCFDCAAADSCYWPDEQKNRHITI